MQPNIWLVGASSGIGAALVDTLAPMAGRLWISARSTDRLTRLADSRDNVSALPMDITDAKSRGAAIAHLEAHDETPDWLILNAGTCEYVDLNDAESELPALYERVMATNFQGPVALAHQALPLLRRSSQARLVGISSSATFTPLPRSQAYGASKAAFSYWLGSMAADLAGEYIQVQMVSPGFVDTPLTRQNDFSMPFLLAPAAAAKRISRGLRKNRRHLHFPRRFTLALRLYGLLPLRWQWALNARLSRHPEHHPSPH